MPTVKNRRVTRKARSRFFKRKNKPVSRRQESNGNGQEAPRVISNSVFALTVKPKGWAELHDQVTDDEKDQQEVLLYKDLVQCYNHGAALVGCEPIIFDKSKTRSAQSISELLQLFKGNICPKDFQVNIDGHYNKKAKREGYHFSMYKFCEFPPQYWHFFEVKHLVSDLRKRNPKLHDFFIVFLRSFVGYCSIPIWFDYIMMDAEFELSEYTSELRECIKAGIPKEVYERTGYTPEQMQERLTAIEKTMKEYATGQAAEYKKLLIATKPRKANSLLRSLKGFPQQSKLVQFMTKACELMKEPVSVNDFCYMESEGEHDGALVFSQRVSVIWNWSDHIASTYSNAIQRIAHSSGVDSPTLCARVLPDGCGGLKMENLEKSITYPQKLSRLQAMFQSITERYTDYKKPPNLI